MDNRHIQCQASALPLPLTPSAENGRDGVMARRYNLVAIYSFGSRAREVAAQVAGEAAEVSYPGSDVDIGVLPAPGQHLTAAERADLTVALEDLLELGQVDMVILPEAPPFLALDIVRGELLYTTDPVAEAEYQLYVLRQAANLAPFERRRRWMLLTREANQMGPSTIQAKIVLDRIMWVRRMLDGIRALPRDSLAEFTADPRNPAAAESYLRRGLEALLDLGRHTLAKGLNCPVTEYREVARELGKAGVLGPEETALLARMAGYRNRLVNFYHEVSVEELYEISTQGLADVERVLEALERWLRAHPELLDQAL